MVPVVGLDVDKGPSIVQDFARRNEPYGKLESTNVFAYKELFCY